MTIINTFLESNVTRKGVYTLTATNCNALTLKFRTKKEMQEWRKLNCPDGVSLDTMAVWNKNVAYVKNGKWYTKVTNCL